MNSTMPCGGGRTRRALKWFRTTPLLAAMAAAIAVQAAALDLFGPPPADDPSAYTDPPSDVDAALKALFSLPDTNHHAYELPNGAFGDKVTQREANVLQPDAQSSFNYPTNGYASPLFGAQPYTQKLLMFEEFGTEKLDPAQAAPALPFPRPSVGPAPAQDPAQVARSGPASSELDGFLQQAGIAPFPTEYANTAARNPWRPDVEAFLARSLQDPPAEGRPPGKGWSHQRWNEFQPQAFFQTAQAGARTNGGVRDRKQLHGYAVGEFGPGGLYHNTAGAPGFDGTTRGISIRIHPNMPVQDHKSVWTFDGTLPPKLLMARYGQPLLMRHYNALPIDPGANRGFGLHTITTHEHNGHNPAESDGSPNAFFFPGQFYDYRWPLQLAGYDSINTSATDPRAAFPCTPGETLFVNDASPGLKTCETGSIRIRGDWRETVSTHWFHDHMLDFTAQNVYKGNAVMMNYYSALDRGNEAIDDGVNLRLPSGSGLPWGNRDYDVNLVIADKAWDQDGQLWFNPFNTDGFLGDRLLVNWQWQPWLDVRARRYRFRLLNGSVSRYLTIAVVREVQGKGGEMPGPAGSSVSYSRVPFHLVANDGNIMEHAVPFDGSMDLDGDGDLNDHKAQLPTQAIAERYDIVIDFAKHGLQPGDKLYFVNLKEHDDGKGSKADIPLRDVLSGAYQAVLATGTDGRQRWENGDPVVGKFLELRVQPYAGTDLSMDPSAFEPARPGKAAGRKMIPLWLDRDNPEDLGKLQNARRRDFEWGRSNGTDLAPWTVKTDGGAGFTADMRRISAAPQLATGPTEAGFSGDGTTEVWSFKTGGGWGHPIHVHFEEGIILKRGGKTPPEWEKWTRKDVYRIGSEPDSTSSVEIAIRFREFAGTYVEHCHNTQHEDNSMLLRWDLEFPGQLTLMPAPIPSWDGVTYVASVGLPTFRTGLGSAASPVTPPDGHALIGAVPQPPLPEPLPPLPKLSLKTVPVPGPGEKELAEFVVDKAAVLQLGKALFWETRVGSDNKTACASCHFSAGADRRAVNQLNPGMLRRLQDTLLPNPDRKFDFAGPNHALKAEDFPFTRFLTGTAGNDPAQRIHVNDNASSQGVFNGEFVAVDAAGKEDSCNFTMDADGFHNGVANTRRVAPRNAPSVINAVFNFRNFWDGRANNTFNGGDPFGRRNAHALVWKMENGSLKQVKVKLPSSSLASQASGPPLSSVEMSCASRTFAQLGQKLLNLPILSTQAIQASDSVLGGYAASRPTYRQLVEKGFSPAFWQGPTVAFTTEDAKKIASMDLKAKPFKQKVDLQVPQMQANFALFFGLAIQMYEATLVADDTRFDQWVAGDSGKLNERERAGFDVFRGKAGCVSCHAGAELTSASFRNVLDVRIERMDLRNGVAKTYDNGFYNIGVRPTHEDLGIGGRDALGRALSESMLLAESDNKEAAAAMLGNDFALWKYIVPTSPVEVNVNGAFKTPGLRNVELTGPYFHNGGKSTLMQVVDHYDRGGDFGVDNAANIHPAIRPLGLTQEEKNDLVSFLLTLTDERVRMERAPFDHPSICVAHGHSAAPPVGINAADDMQCLEAVGAEGRTAPIPPFMNLSPFER